MKITRNPNDATELVVTRLPNSLGPRDYVGMVRRIWPAPYANSAAAATSSDWESGEICAITWRSHYAIYSSEAKIVGITGWFHDPEAPEDIYLRWTGILPEYRLMGFGKDALDMLIKSLRYKFPNHKRLIELVPDNEYGATVALPFFLKYGFVKDDAYVPPAEKTEWDCIPYVYQLCKTTINSTKGTNYVSSI